MRRAVHAKSDSFDSRAFALDNLYFGMSRLAFVCVGDLPPLAFGYVDGEVKELRIPCAGFCAGLMVETSSPIEA
jgi:hypothetical protein